MAATFLATSSTTVARFEIDPKVEEEITATWNQVQSRVLQLANAEGKKVDTTLNIDDVLGYLDQAQQAEKKSSDKHAVVKDVFRKTLQCIQTVGGIVADGASKVFAPAQQCFNVLTFVIQAWQGYEGIFESLTGLLEKCVDFLDRMKYYRMGGMDASLAKVACQHLQLFVEICDRTVKLRHSKRGKFLAFTKVFFLNDDGVKDLLASMESLVDKEGHLVAAQTFNFASEAAVNAKEGVVIGVRTETKVDLLVEDRVDQKRDKDAAKRRETILNALAFSDDKMDKDKKEPSAPWKSTYNNLRNTVVKDTGDWILENPKFKAWLSGSVTASPVLVIEGPEGSGKSYLASTIIRHLLTRAPVTAADPRASIVGFYFVDSDSKEATRSSSLDDVPKSLVWQFTQADIVYQKSVSSICEKVKSLETREIWPQLLSDNKDRSKIQVNFIVVIDGLGDVVEEPLIDILRTVCAELNDRGLRVILTGKPRAFEELAKFQGIRFDTIPISTNNQEDIEKFIEVRMDSMEVLKDISRIGVPELRVKIRDKLTQVTEGDYYKLETALNKISNLDSEPDIDEVLENAGRERSDQIIAEIEKLNKTRTPREIAEINEIILWILTGRLWFDPAKMDAVLYVKGGSSSLLPLETKIKTKYLLFKIDSDGEVNWKSSDIPTYIREKGKYLESDMSSSSKEVQSTEIAIVEHFLNSVCPPELYVKFGFEQFFKQHKKGQGSDYIYQDDKHNAEVKIALTCLQVLTALRDDKTELLRPYSTTYLFNHLLQVDLGIASRELESETGKLLLKLITDDYAIDSLFWWPIDEYRFDWNTREYWLFSGEGEAEILRWLKNSAVIADITDEESRAWISNLTSGSNPEDNVFLPSAKRMAMHLFQEPTPTWHAKDAFQFLYHFYCKIENQKDNTKILINNEIEPSLQQIEQIENWATSALAVETKDSLWEVQVAMLQEGYQFLKDAEKRCRAALDLDSSNWRASHVLANVTESRPEAIEILVKISDRLRNDEMWLQVKDNKEALATILFDLGQKYWDDEKSDLAVQAYTESIERDPAQYSRDLTIIELYHGKQRWSDIIAFLQNLQKSSTETSTCLVKMALTYASDESFHEYILRTAVETQRFDFIDTLYNEAIDSAQAANEFEDSYYLRYYYGTVLNSRPDNEVTAIAMWEHALKDDLPRSSIAKEDILPDLILALAPIYLRLARAAKRDSEIAQGYLERIGDWLQDDSIERNILYPSKLFLSRYYHIQGEEVRAKQAARSVMKVGLEMISDDDPDNDILAYWRLLMVLIPLDDDEDAMASWAMASFACQAQYVQESTVEQPSVEDIKEEADQTAPIVEPVDDATVPPTEEIASVPKNNPEAQGDTAAVDTKSGNVDDTEVTLLEIAQLPSIEELTTTVLPPASTNYWYIAACDGRCGHTWQAASEMYCCKDCIGFQFHPECFEKLQKGTLLRNICSKDHSFLYVPKWDEEKMKEFGARGNKKGMVPLGGNALTLEEWADRLRKKYVDFDSDATIDETALNGAAFNGEVKETKEGE